MFRYRVMRNLGLALGAACTTASSGQTAQALQFSSWVGSVTCTVTTNGSGYTDQQVHKWTLFPSLITSQGAFTFYGATWTVTGGGSHSQAMWKTDGAAYGSIKFWAAGTDLHIALGHSQLHDPYGIYVTPKTGAPYTSEVWEQQFPPIVVSTAQNPVQGSSAPPITGSVGFQEPGGSKSTDMCSWDLQFGTVLLKPLPGQLDKLLVQP